MNIALSDEGSESRQDREDRLYRKITLRIVPFLFICYLVSFLDRINIGFAHLEMTRDLRISEAAYGLGAGIFFIGYVLFEVPSNLLLAKIGARRTFCRIMACWGIVSACTMFVQTAWQLNVLRFLLGAFEAGFFPGIVLYLTYWFPPRRRATVVSWFFAGAALAGMLGGPLSGWIMHGMAGAHGLRGWQWMFLLEGIPAALLGVVAFFLLVDRPEQVSWLTDDENSALRQALSAEQQEKRAVSAASVFDAFRSVRLYWCAFIYFALACGSYAISLWLPVMLREAGVKDVLMIGMYSAIPYGIGALGIVLISMHSDRRAERRLHFTVCSLAGSAALMVVAAFGASLGVAGTLATLSIAVVFIYAAIPIFWSMPPMFLSGKAAAAGIALVSSLGSLGGFASPWLIGLIATRTGRLGDGLYVMAALMIVSGLSVLIALPHATRLRKALA
ncbi:MFS transporter [Paraburkholderia agricolaris]|uniref:MFS transporter n=1 Tax=Paraburkholderia agricolaris TaxID=2152888 RepID=UPI0012913A0C|nr:MFS transporter [Paraburkholderia agricolaris]